MIPYLNSAPESMALSAILRSRSARSTKYTMGARRPMERTFPLGNTTSAEFADPRMSGLTPDILTVSGESIPAQCTGFPLSLCSSITVTSRPDAARYMADMDPAGPPPTTVIPDMAPHWEGPFTFS